MTVVDSIAVSRVGQERIGDIPTANRIDPTTDSMRISRIDAPNRGPRARSRRLVRSRKIRPKWFAASMLSKLC